ncbi:hypothetical protein Fcan01_16915 [Folsomia candida]|uniref:Uncharacterized protein n=1 Tax=Folsomia candida TaxID=158441 RepID=A0A226DSL8_FOLCA|nr:hypothetical protein Fcan01_16915 [Folsomia candida]
MAPTALEKAVYDRTSTADILDYLTVELKTHATTPLVESKVDHLISMAKTSQTDILDIHKRIQICAPPDMSPHQQEFQKLLGKSMDLLSAFAGVKLPHQLRCKIYSLTSSRHQTTPFGTPNFRWNLERLGLISGLIRQCGPQ